MQIHPSRPFDDVLGNFRGGRGGEGTSEKGGEDEQKERMDGGA